MKLRFEKQRHPFVLMAATDTFKIELMSVKLYIRKVTPSPGVLLGHAQALTKGTAKFPITRSTCSVISVSAGHSSHTEDNMYLGQLPKTLVIGMVEDEAFTGSCKKNPYHFQSFDLRSLTLTANGMIVPGTPLKLDQTDSAAVCYQTLFYGLHKLDQDSGSIIKREDWSRGYALLAFDLTPDFSHTDHYSLIDHGKVKLELEFSNALTQAINILVFSQFDNVIEIDKDRNIIFDYS